jgi:hypothetical protein
MRKEAVLLITLMLAACSDRPVSNLATPTSSSSCKLPISIAQPQGGLKGAFVEFPSGKVTIDPSGAGGGYYDHLFSRWLPVSENDVARDGARYAYFEAKVAGTPEQARLHVVDMSTGSDKVYSVGPPGDNSAYEIVEFAPEGIWLSYAGYEGPRGGLFMLDLASGALTNPGVPGMVEQPGGRFVYSGETLIEPVAGGPGVFWFTDGGPNPQAAAIGFTIPARVQRLTVSDGKAEAWFTKQDDWVTVLGTDLAGHPIIAGVNSQTVWLASSPAEAHVIGLPQGRYGITADSQGVWFGGPQGIYLYTNAGELRKVSSQPGYPAGPCI